MPYLEAISSSQRRELQVVNDPHDLVDALFGIVGQGVEAPYHDVAWIHYLGSTKKIHEHSRPNLFPRPRHLASIMASRGKSGFFYRISSLSVQRYVVAPAREVITCGDTMMDSVDVNLNKAISFDGKTLLQAMEQDDFELETITVADKPPFMAYRDVAIGNFLLDNCDIA